MLLNNVICKGKKLVKKKILMKYYSHVKKIMLKIPNSFGKKRGVYQKALLNNFERILNEISITGETVRSNF